MKRIILTAIISAFGLVGTAAADPWKDESGNGRWRSYEHKWDQKRDKEELKFEHRGETPWFEQGSGYWDGHFKHPNGRGWRNGYGGYYYPAPPVHNPPRRVYYPPPPPAYYWEW